MVSGRTVLAVGSGPDSMKDWINQGYEVIRLDIDPSTNPDIVGSMVDMGDIGQHDVVYCSHSLEHLYPHEVSRALEEFYRVLKPEGVAVILVPDLEGVPATDEVLPNCCGLTGLHLYYGDARLIESHPYMAHHSGFVAETLKTALEAAGFKAKTERMSNYNLMGIGTK